MCVLSRFDPISDFSMGSIEAPNGAILAPRWRPESDPLTGQFTFVWGE